MNRLKKQNLNKCISLLREFVDGASAATHKKRVAELALEQLQKITAGTGAGESDSLSCLGRPRLGETP